MQPFRQISGPAAPFLEPNVNTDVIIRIERLTGVPRDDLGAYAFEALRTPSDGRPDPGFILDRPPFRGAPILIAGRNFGCGSSREGAVWALMGLGLRAVIAESFGDIFFNNCFQNGLLPVVLPKEAVDRLAAEAGTGAPVAVDLVAREVRAPSGEAIPFAVDPQRRQALLEGLDEIGATLRRDPEIAAWQARDRAARPWIWATG
ncbi:3-isopropylmalate/(R)-2-methylmalate dehydratase small subunit [Methylobacterium sp. 174MFSha1.1]|uniref:3-isopropylmalate dehydratase small subunit n=1 Tax=Methylobacterium sp. 174MFSha1.1 TaxID=1502749 RepID=UPI0008EBBAA0|nr:3-isopropylmalate dehydratase small subunit [Methylobacterium sp. 174MFSha1.1]SFU49143.1 3-isopropylmalate/(R)-2-methylmalate dehydratase small subunit [Methylobacterium sp. 174MFSha1.1]